MIINKDKLIVQADVYVADGKLCKYRWFSREGMNNILFNKAENKTEVTDEEMYYITKLNRVVIEDSTGISLINFDEVEIYKN